MRRLLSFQCEIWIEHKTQSYIIEIHIEAEQKEWEKKVGITYKDKNAHTKNSQPAIPSYAHQQAIPQFIKQTKSPNDQNTKNWKGWALHIST